MHLRFDKNVVYYGKNTALFLYILILSCEGFVWRQLELSIFRRIQLWLYALFVYKKQRSLRDFPMGILATTVIFIAFIYYEL